MNHNSFFDKKADSELSKCIDNIYNEYVCLDKETYPLLNYLQYQQVYIKITNALKDSLEKKIYYQLKNPRR
jgi:hypothetical protein